VAGIIYDLIDILNQEIFCFEKLLEISELKTDIIVNGEVNSLSELIKIEHDYAGKISRLDRNREKTLKDISIVLNKSIKNMNITNVILLLDKMPEEKEKLMEIKVKFDKVLPKLKKNNEQNKMLVEKSVEYLQFTLNAIQSKNILPDRIYQNKGNEYLSSKNNFFDRKQ